MARSKQRATYDDLLRLPEHLIGEIIDGELIASPRPSGMHGLVITALNIEIGGPFHHAPGGPRGPGGWWFLSEPELHLHGDVTVPDVAAWRRERMPSKPTAPAFELPPDWLCEVLSPSTVRYDRLGKMKIYERERVAHVWLADPVNRTLEIYRLDDGRLQLVNVHSGDERVRAEPFAEVELSLLSLWGEE